jgi:hypothetical protein
MVVQIDDGKGGVRFPRKGSHRSRSPESAGSQPIRYKEHPNLLLLETTKCRQSPFGEMNKNQTLLAGSRFIC